MVRRWKRPLRFIQVFASAPARTVSPHLTNGGRIVNTDPYSSCSSATNRARLPCRKDFFAIILRSFTRGMGLVIAAARDDRRMELSATAAAMVRVNRSMVPRSAIRSFDSSYSSAGSRNRKASQALTKPMMIASRGSGAMSSAIVRNTRVFTSAMAVPSPPE